MGFGDLLRRKELSEEVDADGQFSDLDGSIADAISDDLSLDMEDLSAAPVSQFAPSGVDEQQPSRFMSSALPASPDGVLTGHAQERMAAFKVFDDANRAARDELTRIGKAFTAVVMSYNLGRDFLDECQEEIVRASDLEAANQRFATENRRLAEKLEKHERNRERQDDLIETMKRREARLVQEADALRDSLADLRLELVETRNASTAAETARSELHMTLAARSADTDRIQSELDALREKNAAASVELASSQKRYADTKRRLEEIQSTQATDASRISDLSNRLAAEEKDVARLQRQLDQSEARGVEIDDARRTAEQELRETERRHQTEMQAMRAELDQWKGRVQAQAASQLNEARMSHGDAMDMVSPTAMRPARKQALPPHAA